MYDENPQDKPLSQDNESEPQPSSDFLASVTHGLSQQQKMLPSRWLYDTRGSELFERITSLPEYYPTRTEIGILEANGKDIAKAVGSKACIVEFGAGAGTKTRLLLSALDAPKSYTPIDISADFLAFTMERLAGDYPEIEIIPLVADFTSPTALEKANLPQGNRVGFFPGSTIGNLSDTEIADFLSGARKGLGQGAKFIIGIDLIKGEDILVPAYNDSAGVTAAFNLNLLERINRELHADFDLRNFKHEARWVKEQSRIEMHLISQGPQTVHIGEHRFYFSKGESIHTENSRKFTYDHFAGLAHDNGWSITTTWTDSEDYFCLALLQ